MPGTRDNVDVPGARDNVDVPGARDNGDRRESLDRLVECIGSCKCVRMGHACRERVGVSKDWCASCKAVVRYHECVSLCYSMY